MSHYKRRKPRRNVRCNICTPGRVGNSAKEGYGRPGWRRRMESSHANMDDWDGNDELDWDDDPWDDEFERAVNHVLLQWSGLLERLED